MFDFFSQKIYWADTSFTPEKMAVLTLVCLKVKY